MDNKELNYSILYGVVTKVRPKHIVIDFGYGKIKVVSDELEFSQIKTDYTVGITGRLKSGFIRHYLVADKMSILSKKAYIWPEQ